MLANWLGRTIQLALCHHCCVVVIVQVFELSFYKGVSRSSSLFSVGMDAGRALLQTPDTHVWPL
jgi:hypothetical protein